MSEAIDRNEDLVEPTYSTLPNHQSLKIVGPDDFNELSDQFTFLEELGHGAFGVVYRAHQILLDRDVAIKFSLIDDPTRRDLYVNEAKNAAKVECPGIVPIHQVGILKSGRIYVVQRLIVGGTLRDLLNKYKRLASPATCLILIEIARAVAKAHVAGIVHRDLKPENILIDSHGKPWITDFGLALADTEQRDHRGETAGTPRYMSPEQISGQADKLDGRSDIFAIGVMLYEMLTGRPPFAGKTHKELKEQILNRDPKPIRQKVPYIPASIDNIFQKCCAKKMQDRYSNGNDLAAALEAELHKPYPIKLAVAILLAVVIIIGSASFFAGPRDGTGIQEQFLMKLINLQERSLEIQEDLIRHREKNGLKTLDSLPPSLEEKRRVLRADVESTRQEINAYERENGSLPFKIQSREVTLEQFRSILDHPFDFIWAEFPSNLPNPPMQNPPLVVPALLADLPGHTGKVLSMTFSTDGKLFATGSEDSTIKLWNTADWSLHSTLRGYPSAVQCVAFSPDNLMLAWGGDGAPGLKIKVWNLREQREQVTLTAMVAGGLTHAYSVAFSPDNQSLAAASSGPARVWSLAKPEESHQLNWQQSLPSYSYSVAFSPDNATVAIGCHGGDTNIAESVRLWNWRTKRQGPLLVGSDSRFLALSHSDVRGVVAYSPNATKLVRVTKGSKLTGDHGMPFPRMSLNPFEANAGSLLIWDLNGGMRKTTFEVPAGNAFAVGFLASGDVVVAAVQGPEGMRGFGRMGTNAPSDDDLLNLWDSDHQMLSTISTKHQSSVYAVAFSTDSAMIATAGSDDNLVKVWDRLAVVKLGERSLADERNQLNALCERALELTPDSAENHEFLREWYQKALQKHQEIHTATQLAELIDLKADNRVRQFVIVVQRVSNELRK